jgi:hypothetical protein
MRVAAVTAARYYCLVLSDINGVRATHRILRQRLPVALRHARGNTPEGVILTV